MCATTSPALGELLLGLRPVPTSRPCLQSTPGLRGSMGDVLLAPSPRCTCSDQGMQQDTNPECFGEARCWRSAQSGWAGSQLHQWLLTMAPAAAATWLLSGSQPLSAAAFSSSWKQCRADLHHELPAQTCFQPHLPHSALAACNGQESAAFCSCAPHHTARVDGAEVLHTGWYLVCTCPACTVLSALPACTCFGQELSCLLSPPPMGCHRTMGCHRHI